MRMEKILRATHERQVEETMDALTTELLQNLLLTSSIWIYFRNRADYTPDVN